MRFAIGKDKISSERWYAQIRDSQQCIMASGYLGDLRQWLGLASTLQLKDPTFHALPLYWARSKHFRQNSCSQLRTFHAISNNNAPNISPDSMVMHVQTESGSCQGNIAFVKSICVYRVCQLRAADDSQPSIRFSAQNSAFAKALGLLFPSAIYYWGDGGGGGGWASSAFVVPPLP